MTASNDGGLGRMADPRIDMYLDGLLSGPELQAFESELAGSPELRRQMDLQERIDGGLRELFVYRAPEAATVGRIGPGPAEAAPAPSRGLFMRGGRRWMAIAAVLALLVGSWAAYINITTPGFDKVITLGEVYRDFNSVDFVCENDAQFAKAIKDNFGQALLLVAPPGTKLLGWNYPGKDPALNAYTGTVISEKTLVLLTEVDGRSVKVVIDRTRAERGRQMGVPANAGFNKFRKEVGDLVLYELTSLDRPMLLDGFYDPDRSAPPAAPR